MAATETATTTSTTTATATASTTATATASTSATATASTTATATAPTTATATEATATGGGGGAGKRVRDKCVICFEPFGKSIVAVETECLHVFCADCLAEWLSKQNTCPVCRRDDPVVLYASMSPSFLSSSSSSPPCSLFSAYKARLGDWERRRRDRERRGEWERRRDRDHRVLMAFFVAELAALAALVAAISVDAPRWLVGASAAGLVAGFACFPVVEFCTGGAARVWPPPGGDDLGGDGHIV